MSQRRWTVRATCPHGVAHDLAFDMLGYLKVPTTCGHPTGPPMSAPTHQVRERLGPFARWRTRRAAARIERAL